MKIKVVIFHISLLAMYFILLFGFELQNIWFSLALYVLSIKILVRSFALRQDSSLFFGIMLLWLSVCGAVRMFFEPEVLLMVILYISSICFASLSVFLIFRQNIHLKVVAIFSIEVILLGVLKYSFFNTSFCHIIHSASFLNVTSSLVAPSKNPYLFIII